MLDDVCFQLPNDCNNGNSSLLNEFMKAEKKLSIKVKSKTEQRIMDDPEVEMITQWDIKKIIYAFIVLLLVIVLPAFYFSSLDEADTATKIEKPPVLRDSIKKNHGSIKTDSFNQPGAETSANNRVPETSIVSERIKVDVTEKQVIPEKPLLQTPVNQATSNTQGTDKESIKETGVAKNIHPPVSTINTEALNPHITRAQLARGINKLEPFGKIELPILVDTSKAQSIIYFTEVNNMSGRTVFHEWLKEGKSIFKKKVIIRGNRWRFYTSKLFPYNSAGQWQVRISNAQGDILHKINFSVEKR